MTDQWFYAKGNQQLGPVAREGLVDLVTRGQIAATDLVWTEGMPQWTPAGTVFAPQSIGIPPLATPSVATPLVATPLLGQAGRLDYFNTQANTTFTYATFSSRLVAQVIDTIVVRIAVTVVAVAIGVTTGAFRGSPDPDTQAMVTTAIQLTWLLFSWLYYCLLESSSMQATLGKRAMGLKVVTEDGARITFGRASGRYFMSLVSFVVVFAGYFMGMFTSRKQTLHDIVSKTLVVKPAPKLAPEGGFAVVAPAPQPQPPQRPL